MENDTMSTNALAMFFCRVLTLALYGVRDGQRGEA